jgi:uncharacterized protein
LKDVQPGELARLLDLQQEDTSIQRLAHRKETLPEAQNLAEMNERLAELAADIEIATKQRDEIAREQDRLDGEIGLLATKIDREEQRLFSGAVSNPKELGALQAEVESLKRRRGGLEDGLLEIMVQREQADTTLSTLQSDQSDLSARAEELSKVVATITSEIDAELDEHTKKRAEITPEISDELLKLYDELRASKAGVGAARLEGHMCSGCHTELPAVEVERLRAAGGVQRCDNCRRILVV